MSSILVKLRSKEGQTISLMVEAETCVSQLIRETLMDDNPRETDMDGVLIELTRISFSCLQLIVQFMNHYHIEPMHPISTPLAATCWDKLVPQS